MNHNTISQLTMGISCGIFAVTCGYAFDSMVALVLMFLSMFYCLFWLAVNLGADV